MKRRQKRSWIRASLLLGALASGAITTRFIPEYEEVAASNNQPSSAAVKTSTESNSGVTGIDVDLRYLTLISMIS